MPKSRTARKARSANTVTLPRSDYERLLEAAEDREDRHDVAAALRDLDEGRDEVIPIEIVDRMLAGENRIKVWREHRGLTQAAVAQQAGIDRMYLSQIETGQRQGSRDTIGRIAEALGVRMFDLIDPAMAAEGRDSDSPKVTLRQFEFPPWNTVSESYPTRAKGEPCAFWPASDDKNRLVGVHILLTALRECFGLRKFDSQAIRDVLERNRTRIQNVARSRYHLGDREIVLIPDDFEVSRR